MKRYILPAMLMMASLAPGRAFNVFMAGDSHVCSDVYPEKVGDILIEADPETVFSYWGKIGAGFYTYNDTPEYMGYIYESEPDILIVHLGTNDCYTKKFSKKKYKADMETFYNNVKSRFPNCRIVYVTPFFNKFKDGKTINKANKTCAIATREFARKHRDTYVVDNNDAHGMDFLKAGASLIRPDNVHLTEAGYGVLGEQVGRALLEIEDLWMLEEPPYLGD